MFQGLLGVLQQFEYLQEVPFLQVFLVVQSIQMFPAVQVYRVFLQHLVNLVVPRDLEVHPNLVLLSNLQVPEDLLSLGLLEHQVFQFLLASQLGLHCLVFLVDQSDLEDLFLQHFQYFLVNPEFLQVLVYQLDIQFCMAQEAGLVLAEAVIHHRFLFQHFQGHKS
jgi:hypothetical protein